MRRLQIFILALFTLVINMSFLIPISARADAATASNNPCDSTNLIGATGTTNATGTSGATGTLTQQATPTCAPYSTDKNNSLRFCGVDTTKSGVLIENPVVGAAGNMGVFTCYVSILLIQNVPFVMLLATMIIIGSAVLYMLSGGSSGELTKAKQRIGGVLAGVALFFLIRFLVPIIANGLTL